MKQCFKCVFYDKMSDDLLQPDYIVEGKGVPEFHICHVYKSIPKDIIHDKKECKNFVDKTTTSFAHSI